MRLNKYIALSTDASRRTGDTLIFSGAVSVNGNIVLQPSYQVEENDSVSLNGKTVAPFTHAYYILNKPPGYICSTVKQSDSDKLAIDIINTATPLHSIGRLDKNTTGLLLLTNDGDFTKAVTHPSMRVEKEYIATTSAHINKLELQIIREGVVIDGRRVVPQRVKLINSKKIQVVVVDGKKHEVRLIVGAAAPVETLRRVRIGSLRLKSLDEGEYRRISRTEAYALLERPQTLKK